MRARPSKDTKPEIALRSALHRRGLRFRKHRKDLPGKPDAAFATAMVALFVDGDFWHGRDYFERGKCPKTRPDYWKAKFERNAERDKEIDALLSGIGWLAVRAWASEIMADAEAVADRVEAAVRERERESRRPVRQSPAS